MINWHKLYAITGNSAFKALYGFFIRISAVLPDRSFIRLMAWIRMERMGHKSRMDIDHPVTLNEKIQWLKLYNKSKNYSSLVDKFAVREYITKKLGAQYLIPLIGVYNSFEEIHLDELPEEFVVKCTHDSGSVVLCDCREDLLKHKKKLKRALRRDYFYYSRDYSYKNIPHRIIIEKRLRDDRTNGCLTDYKFYCFNGEPKFLYISVGLHDHATTRMSFVNLDFTPAGFGREDYEELEFIPPKPDNYEEMLQIAAKLSEGIVFVRVDMYEVHGQIYFSELTFSPCNGFMLFVPEEYDRILGEQLILPA